MDRNEQQIARRLHLTGNESRRCPQPSHPADRCSTVQPSLGCLSRLNRRTEAMTASKVGTFAAGLLALLALAACAENSGSGSSSTPAAPPQPRSPINSGQAQAASPTIAAVPASPAITTAEVQAVAERVFPGPHPAGCNWRDRSTCPITGRLAARLERLSQPPKVGPGPIVLLCRCQNVPAPTAQFDPEVTPAGGVAHVTLGALKLDLIMLEDNGELLVDDTQCTGRDPVPRSTTI
jgi:hypothetical protein